MKANTVRYLKSWCERGAGKLVVGRDILQAYIKNILINSNKYVTMPFHYHGTAALVLAHPAPVCGIIQPQ
jgi:hypothetical protein